VLTSLGSEANGCVRDVPLAGLALRRFRQPFREFQGSLDVAHGGQIRSDPGDVGWVYRSEAQQILYYRGRILEVTLAFELTSPRSVRLTQKRDVPGRRFVFMELLGQLERLLRAPFV
jgi:hypothetical protein